MGNSEHILGLVKSVVNIAGIYSDDEKYNSGDVVFKDGTLYVCLNSNHWEPLGESDPFYNPSDRKEQHTKINNCPHCGAPVNPYKMKCEYCGGYY